MVEEPGRVVGLQGAEAWVQTVRQGACQSCKVRSGCGQRLLTELSGGKASQVRVRNVLQAQVGDQVLLGIGETALLRASLLVYLVPLLGLVAGAVLAHRLLGLGDAGAALVALSTMLAAFFPVSLYQRRSVSGQFQPVLLRVLKTNVASEYEAVDRSGLTL